MLKHDPNDTKPCRHMRQWVSALADGALSGLARWYTERHVGLCPQCQKGMGTIIGLRDRLRLVNARDSTFARLSEKHWAAVEAQWERVDRERAGAGP